MATTTTNNVIAATPAESIIGPGAFLKFVGSKLPTIFTDHPLERLYGSSASWVTSAHASGHTAHVFVDSEGGRSPSQWRLTGVIVRYNISSPIMDPELGKAFAIAIQAQYMSKRNFESFSVEGVNFTFTKMIPPASGLLLIHQLTEESERSVYEAGFDALGSGVLCDQIDGKIYRLTDAEAYTSKTIVSIRGNANRLTTDRIAMNKLAVKAAQAAYNAQRDAVVYIRCNNPEDKLIDGGEFTNAKPMSLLDVTVNGVRAELTPALRTALVNEGVDVDYRFRLQAPVINNVDDFRQFAFARFEQSKNLIIRPRSLSSNSTLLILAPGNMLARGVAASVRIPATVTGLCSTIDQHPASRCFNAVTGAAMFDAKLRVPGGPSALERSDLTDTNATVLVFPSREVQTFLQKSETPGSIVDILGMIRGLYARSFVDSRSPHQALFNKLLGMLPSPADGAPGFTDTFAVLCNNIDALDTLVDYFPRVNSAVGTTLPLSEQYYFNNTNDEDGLIRTNVGLRVIITHQCFEFLQAIGAAIPAEEPRRYIDFTVDGDMNVDYLRRPGELSDDQAFRVSKTMEYVIKCTVDNVLAQLRLRRDHCNIESVRMFTVPQQVMR